MYEDEHLVKGAQSELDKELLQATMRTELSRSDLEFGILVVQHPADDQEGVPENTTRQEFSFHGFLPSAPDEIARALEETVRSLGRLCSSAIADCLVSGKDRAKDRAKEMARLMFKDAPEEVRADLERTLESESVSKIVDDHAEKKAKKCGRDLVLLAILHAVSSEFSAKELASTLTVVEQMMKEEEEE